MAQSCHVNVQRSAGIPSGMREASNGWTSQSSNAVISGSEYQMNRVDPTMYTRPTSNVSSLINQRALPTSNSFQTPLSSTRASASNSTTIIPSDSQQRQAMIREVHMRGAEGNGIIELGSEEEIEGCDSKKKGKLQRFFCEGFPPCNLSFTRSEHLARHIRKHTGERPFKCHCSRRFSRLDNLRQHAQTVHQNEEIPQDSLAATGTRFQRRPDRGRASGMRVRVNPSNGQSVPVRGHTRNSLSTSSIGSVGSTYSNNHGQIDGVRPSPLVFGNGERGGRPNQEISGRPDSSGGFATPVSTNQESPRWIPGIHSPDSSSGFPMDQRPNRRLSVPSTANTNPCMSSPPIGSHVLPLNDSCLSNSPEVLMNYSAMPHRKPNHLVEDTSRRRTWHPDTVSNQFPQGIAPFLADFREPLSKPSAMANNAPNLPRLPGIESFGPLQRPPSPRHFDVDRNGLSRSWNFKGPRGISDSDRWRTQPITRFEELSDIKKLQSSRRANHSHHLSTPILPREIDTISSWNRSGSSPLSEQATSQRYTTECKGSGEQTQHTSNQPLHSLSYSGLAPTKRIMQDGHGDLNPSYPYPLQPSAGYTDPYLRNRQPAQFLETPKFGSEDNVRLDALVAAASL